MTRNLTEKQQKFLDVLFEEAQGDPVQAKKLAGYADSVASTSVVFLLGFLPFSSPCKLQIQKYQTLQLKENLLHPRL